MKKNKNKIKSKKGMTLIEVIISVTLLSILIVPLSSIVISSLKNSKGGEIRQEASYIGQKVIEELKSYDYIKLDSDGSFKLLDGDKITKNINEDSFTGKFQRTIFGSPYEENSKGETKFNVEVTMKKNEDFNFDNISNTYKTKAKYKVTFENDGSNYVVYINDNKAKKLVVTDDLVFNYNDNNLEINIKSNESLKIDNTNSSDENSIIIIDLKNTYDKSTNINLINNTKNMIEVYLLKDSNLNNIKMIPYLGNIMVSEINNYIANMYTFQVVVKNNKDEVLFKGSSSGNFVIK